MKRFMVVLIMVLMFVTTASAGRLDRFMSTDTRTVPDTNNMVGYLGEVMVTQQLQGGGTITMRGYQAQTGIQYVSLTFKGENRPYCWWFAEESGGHYSQGRCDVDNNGTYEYKFGEDGRTGTTHHYRPQWKTAEY